MDKKISKIDWWKVNGLFWIVPGALGILLGIVIGWSLKVILLDGVFAILVGLGMLQRSKLLFWVVFVSTSVAVAAWLFTAVKTLSIPVGFLTWFVRLLLLLILWRQMKQERVKQ